MMYIWCAEAVLECDTLRNTIHGLECIYINRNPLTKATLLILLVIKFDIYSEWHIARSIYSVKHIPEQNLLENNWYPTLHEQT